MGHGSNAGWLELSALFAVLGGVGGARFFALVWIVALFFKNRVLRQGAAKGWLLSFVILSLSALYFGLR